jgi:hypothetical protein
VFGNSGDSPMVLITYKSPPVVDTLSEYGDGISRKVMTLPDSFNDKYWNVRLSPPQPCRLTGIHLEFKLPESEKMTGTSDTLVGGADFQVYAWDSNVTTRFPITQALDSTLVSVEDAVYSVPVDVQWTAVDVSDWNLEFGGAFHVGYSIPDYANMKAQLLGMPIWTYVNSDHDDPNDHSSIEYAASGGWSTIQDNWGERRDLRIRAEVEYEDGSRAMLHPDGTSTPVEHR